MAYEAAVIEFLSQKENLPIVLEIADMAEKVKDKLHLEFWKCLENSLNVHLNISTHKNDWVIERGDDNNVLSQWNGIGIYPAPKPQSLYLRVLLVQWWRDLHLVYGICWSQECHNIPGIDILKELVEKLRDEGYAPDAGGIWYPAVKHTSLLPRSNDFLLRVAHDPGSMASDISDVFWDFFSSNADTIKAVNRAIAANQGDS